MKAASQGAVAWRRRRKFGYAVDNDGDYYVIFRRTGNDEKFEEDESLSVYLPRDPAVRLRAARAIALALNRARIPGTPPKEADPA